MARVADWVEGVRLRTLPAAVAPVIAGSAIAWFHSALDVPRALLAGVVALALQVGVNFANDYSDGIRGTDADRVGPKRLVGSGAARPGTVKAAAFACFAVAAAAGLVLVWLTQAWWLLAVGAAAILAAWYYTGGRRPYGYAGLGEVFVFVFFGLVAVCGTVYVQQGGVGPDAVATSVWVGALACALLVANNLRDIAGDIAVGKRTLATRLGDRGTRVLYVALVGAAAAGIVATAALTTPWALLALAMLAVLVRPLRAVWGGARGPALIGVLKLTGIGEVIAALGLFVGVWLS